MKVRRQGNHRPLHLRDVVAEADGVDQFAGPLVVLGIERVDVADAAAHEQKDDRLGLGREMRPELHFLNLAVGREHGAHGDAEESAAGLEQEFAAIDRRRDRCRDSPWLSAHADDLPDIDELVEIEQQPRQALQPAGIVVEIGQRAVPFGRRGGRPVAMR